ncbi:hypothetical protein G6O67_000346 [Ophiocordyceps sinensis]|uniref:Uncharacterized protein n=1 Tax=Ophiocordyceps sinensis TaxID=72228 RepID=A0A8H4PZ20_9HYPO|nr:hypothetical protein G6O67_000346 [Ophiocordyceps sinensis]
MLRDIHARPFSGSQTYILVSAQVPRLRPHRHSMLGPRCHQGVISLLQSNTSVMKRSLRCRSNHARAASSSISHPCLQPVLARTSCTQAVSTALPTSRPPHT